MKGEQKTKSTRKKKEQTSGRKTIQRQNSRKGKKRRLRADINMITFRLLFVRSTLRTRLTAACKFCFKDDRWSTRTGLLLVFRTRSNDFLSVAACSSSYPSPPTSDPASLHFSFRPTPLLTHSPVCFCGVCLLRGMQSRFRERSLSTSMSSLSGVSDLVSPAPKNRGLLARLGSRPEFLSVDDRKLGSKCGADTVLCVRECVVLGSLCIKCRSCFAGLGLADPARGSFPRGRKTTRDTPTEFHYGLQVSKLSLL